MSKSLVIQLPEMIRNIEIDQQWLVRRDAICADCVAVQTVTNQAAFDVVGELMKSATKASNELEAMRTGLTAPFTAVAKSIKAVSDKAREPLEMEKSRLKGLLSAYATEQSRKARIERERIEDEQRKAVERQLAEQREAEQLGLAEESEMFVPAVPEIAPTVMTAKADSVRVVPTLEWVAVDESEIPAQFCAFDPRKLNAYLREPANKDRITAEVMEGKQPIHGIQFSITNKVASR
jgi:hypothetical protein